ncbi:MAG: SHOCT domain-containing protein [Bacillota bacterium]
MSGLCAGYYNGFGGWSSWLFSIMHLVVVVGVIYLVFKFFSSLTNDGTGDSMALLKKKFAKGEISQEEFRERKEVLEEG